MKKNLNSKHVKNKIYKQFEDSIYGKAPVPAGYDLLLDYDNQESGFVGKVYMNGNHLVVVTEGTYNLSLSDWMNDYVITKRKRVPKQFYDYVDIYKKIQNVKKYVPNLKTTWLGYSLTGTPAQMMGLLTGDETVCFAPLGAGNTIAHLDEIYHNSAELQKLFPNYKGFENTDTSNITNYYCEGDPVVNVNKQAQIGDVYVVPNINNGFPHYLYNWGDLDNAILDERFSSNIVDNVSNNDRLLYGNVEKTYTEKTKQKGIKNISTNYSSKNSSANNCPGSYSVKGYTREDGTKVQGYTRDCYKHKGSVPKLDNLSFEELERWIKELI